MSCRHEWDIARQQNDLSASGGGSVSHAGGQACWKVHFGGASASDPHNRGGVAEFRDKVPVGCQIILSVRNVCYFLPHRKTKPNDVALVHAIIIKYNVACVMCDV